MIDVTMLTIVIPTFDEADNVAGLVGDIGQHISPVSGGVAVLFVDDSPGDDTVAAIEAAQCSLETSMFQVGYIHRTGENRWGGLAGAVTDGLRAANSEYVLVMDGDRQHPPSCIPVMLEALMNVDVVVASRYCRGGDPGGLSSPLRHVVSRAATRLTKLLFPRALRRVSDPMTGFFMVRKGALDLSRLQANGFKILLELFVTHSHLQRTEVPLQMESRGEGASKANAREGLRFLQQLARLRLALTH